MITLVAIDKIPKETTETEKRRLQPLKLVIDNKYCHRGLSLHREGGRSYAASSSSCLLFPHIRFVNRT